MPKPNVKIKTVSVTYNRKINTGNFSSADVGITIWADIDESEENVHAVMTGLWKMAKTNVKEQSAAVRGKEETNAHLGFPED